ncbi:hypothetical protein BJ165DRAFT_1510968 [Panaeolus papilionaceus]|nr:hypothetical protein BJ165DRAFT_1510968 [Panaeolus papilionaceus]
MLQNLIKPSGLIITLSLLVLVAASPHPNPTPNLNPNPAILSRKIDLSVPCDTLPDGYCTPLLSACKPGMETQWTWSCGVLWVKGKCCASQPGW